MPDEAIAPGDRPLARDLRLRDVRALRGANLWRAGPCAVGELEIGVLDALGAARRAALLAPLVQRVPALAADDAIDVAGWGRLIATLALELQRRAGAAVHWSQVTPPAVATDPAIVAIEYEEPGVGAASLREAAALLRDCLRGEAPDLDDAVDEFRARLKRERLDPASASLVAAAQRRGIPVHRAGEERAVQLGLGARQHRVDAELAERARRTGADATVDALFPPGTSGRIPIAVVTGTNGKTTTTRLIAHLLRATGARVGFTTTDGVYYEQGALMEGDMTGPVAADMILSHPGVDAAVLETARGGILRAGLGFDACDVSVVLNVSADHLGLRGIHTVEQLAEVKAVVVTATRPGGHTVLNADDPLVMRMRADTHATPVLFTSRPLAASAAAAAHVAAGGMAVSVEPRDGERFVLHRGGADVALLPVADAPLTLGGAARFQVQNVAAAVAAAWALGVEAETIARAVRTFGASSEQTPGRMNAFAVRGATVVVDYAHNVAAIEALLEYAARADAGRRIGVLAVPGDRRDEDIRAVGALARSLDLAIFKEHPDYRRGRAPGDTVRLMTEGLVAAGGDPARVVTTLDESAAVQSVLALLQPRDLVLFIADDLGETTRAFGGGG